MLSPGVTIENFAGAASSKAKQFCHYCSEIQWPGKACKSPKQMTQVDCMNTGRLAYGEFVRAIRPLRSSSDRTYNYRFPRKGVHPFWVIEEMSSGASSSLRMLDPSGMFP